jgi:transcriptional regulator with XRE-family HTH domain
MTDSNQPFDNTDGVVPYSDSVRWLELEQWRGVTHQWGALKSHIWPEILSEAINLANLSPSELAEFLQVPNSDVRAWEIGVTIPAYAYRSRICKFLGISFSDLNSMITTAIWEKFYANLLCNQSHEPNTGVKPSDDDEQ